MKSHLLLSLGLLGACVVGEDDPNIDDEVGALAGPNARMTIVQHNIEKKGGALDKALDAARSNNAIGITLQEVCPAMKDDLIQKHGNQWTISFVENEHTPVEGCGGAKGFVVAIWMGGATGEKSTYDQLGPTDGVPGQMACVAFPHKGVTTHLCSVKLISTAPDDGAAEAIRKTQTAAIAAIAKTWKAGTRDDFGIVAGDFNGRPETKPLDHMYAPQLGGDGMFTEYNRGGGSRAGASTAHAAGDNGPYDKKIDYVFFSTNRAPINGPAVSISRDASDHDLVVSTVAMAKN